MPPGPYRATTCQGRDLNFGSQTYFFDHTRTLRASPMPGPPPRQHKHERQYTPSTHPSILTRRIWNDDYGGQMIFGDLVGLKFPDICLTDEEKPHPGNLSRPEIEPRPATWQAHMLPLAPQRWTKSMIKVIKSDLVWFHGSSQPWLPHTALLVLFYAWGWPDFLICISNEQAR